MDATHHQDRPTNTEANIRKAAEALAEVVQMKQRIPSLSRPPRQEHLPARRTAL
jgi:hypothetical protein